VERNSFKKLQICDTLPILIHLHENETLLFCLSLAYYYVLEQKGVTMELNNEFGLNQRVWVNKTEAWHGAETLAIPVVINCLMMTEIGLIYQIKPIDRMMGTLYSGDSLFATEKECNDNIKGSLHE
jgi:hypothetical protein